MRIRTSFPHEIREIENCWIPMPDGCRLAARVWLPCDAEARPVPAIIEYIPYRKRDRTRWRDEPMHRYFAGHGYAAIRIDLRGSGESDGVLCDEYLDQEQDDGVAAIAWIASQPWCTGAVGMMGKSWGGFNALQIAARRPPALHAIITVCSTDDRYADDAHYMGGCLLNENLMWGSVLLTINAQPPDPVLVGDRWRAMWLERLAHSPLYAETWLRHQRRDEYWKHGSVAEDFSLIRCPVYAIGGWADGYSNAVPRLLAGLSVPRKGLVGPWAHVYPHDGVPGPAIGFLQEALRWWDHWLKGRHTGIMDEPQYRVWMQDSVLPRSFHEVRPGRWVAEARWPTGRGTVRRYVLNWRRLEDRPGTVTPLQVRSPNTVGLTGGAWCGFGVVGEMPGDQRADDGKSVHFDSRPLEKGFEILGAPVVHLTVTVDRPRAFLAVRLNDVAPDGASTRVTYGLLNLTHRNGHETLEALEPGTSYAVTVRLNDVAHSFAAGHRLRIAISTAYWPVAWPSPESPTVTLLTGTSTLELPERPPHALDDHLPPFDEPEAAAPQGADDVADDEIRRVVQYDLATGETVYTNVMDRDERGDLQVFRIAPIGLEMGHGITERFTINDDEPGSARAELHHSTVSRRDDWSVRVETRTRLTATNGEFRLEASLEAFEGERRVFDRTWDRRVPRDLM